MKAAEMTLLTAMTRARLSGAAQPCTAAKDGHDEEAAADGDDEEWASMTCRAGHAKASAPTLSLA